MLDPGSLKWHYKQTVIENICALFLEREGGGKRMPWRGGLSLVMKINEGEYSGVGGVPSAVFSDSTVMG